MSVIMNFCNHDIKIVKHFTCVIINNTENIKTKNVIIWETNYMRLYFIQISKKANLSKVEVYCLFFPDNLIKLFDMFVV